MKSITGILALLAIYIPNQLHFPASLDQPGLNVFNLFFLIAVMVLLIGRAAKSYDTEGGAITSQASAPLRNVLLFYYFAIGISLITAIAWGSPHVFTDITVYKTIVTYSLLYFIAFHGIRELRQARILLAVVLIVFAVASLEAIREGIVYGFERFNDAKRAAGPFSAGGANANFAGVYYSIFASFCLALALFGTSLPRMVRLVAAGFYIMGLIAIFATFSRQSFMIIGVTTLILTFRKTPLLGVLAVTLLLNYAYWAPEGVIQRVETTQQRNEMGELVLEDSAESRYVLWGAALDIIKDHPEGVGLNQFKRIVDPYMPSWIEARDAQNQYLLVAAESGIIGIVAYVSLLIALLIQGLKLYWHTGPPEAKVLGMAFSIAVIAVMLGNLYSSTFHMGELMGNFWILAGLISRYRFLSADALPSPDPAEIRMSPLERTRHVYGRWQRHPPG